MLDALRFSASKFLEERAMLGRIWLWPSVSSWNFLVERSKERVKMPVLSLNSDRRPGRIYLAYRQFYRVNNVA
jgi:hypothetical protein